MKKIFLTFVGIGIACLALLWFRGLLESAGGQVRRAHEVSTTDAVPQELRPAPASARARGIRAGNFFDDESEIADRWVPVPGKERSPVAEWAGDRQEVELR